MEIKLSRILKGMDGESPLPAEPSARQLIEVLPVDIRNAVIPIFRGLIGEPVDLKNICINALLSPMEGDTDEKKWERYEIFKKLRDANDVVDLESDDIVTIKKAIGRFQPPLIYGQCKEMLENAKTAK